MNLRGEIRFGKNILHTFLLRKKTLYLAVFLDVYSRKVVDWSMDNKMKEKLVLDAFNQAYGREHSLLGLVVYSDQGAQYTGVAFQALLRSKKQY